MSFTMQDFNNMHKDDCGVVCHHDFDLVVKKFESCKEKNRYFFYSIIWGDDGKVWSTCFISIGRSCLPNIFLGSVGQMNIIFLG